MRLSLRPAGLQVAKYMHSQSECKARKKCYQSHLLDAFIMVSRYGMAQMNRRTTFALDEITIQRLKTLSEILHISQAEVVRRAVEQAERDLHQRTQHKIQLLQRYVEKKGISSSEADAYLMQVAKERNHWRGEL